MAGRYKSNLNLSGKGENSGEIAAVGVLNDVESKENKKDEQTNDQEDSPLISSGNGDIGGKFESVDAITDAVTKENTKDKPTKNPECSPQIDPGK